MTRISEPKVLVAGPKGSGKTNQLIRVCYENNLPFIVRDDKQMEQVEKASKRMYLPIKVLFVDQLREDSYAGPVVIENGGMFFWKDWDYIKHNCYVYAESKNAEVVINTKTAYGSYISWVLTGSTLTFLLQEFAHRGFGLGFLSALALVRLIIWYKNK